MKTFRAACCAAPLLALAAQAWAGQRQVEEALRFIQGACVLPNARSELRRTPQGRAEIVITLADGQRRATSLERSDADQFEAGAEQLRASESLTQLECMDPRIDQVLTLLPRLPDRPAPMAEAPAYVPPALPAVAAPPMAVQVQVQVQAQPQPQPASPPLPATGALTVSEVLGNAPATAATPARAGTVQTGGVGFSVAGCRAAGRDVVCDIKIANQSGRDTRVVVEGAFSRLYGADGSEVGVSWATMGNQRDDMRWNNKQAVMKVIADTQPVLNLLFASVPETLTTIKRLEISIGQQTGNGTEMSKLQLADQPIQGR